MKRYATERFKERRELLAPVMPVIEEGLARCSEDEAVLMKFLYGTMPVRDAGEYGFEIFLSYVKHALMLRENVAWCKELPEDVFVNYVLYDRINSEDITDCRPFFYEQIMERVAGMSLREAILEINYWCAEHATYEATDGRTASPMTMYRSGKGRCGEESTFAVTAYRSVGIAARQVYTPRWAHCDDNHAWVEVFVDGEWHFLGACEPEEVLDTGWFSGPANRAILIHTRNFSDYVKESDEEYLGKEGALHYFNHTAFYGRTKLVKIGVKDENGNPVPGAHVAVEILNMAEFFPAAVLIADENGEVQVTLGLGDIRVRAFDGTRRAEAMMRIEDEDSLELVLHEEAVPAADDTWQTLEIRAPKEVPVRNVVITKEQKERNAARMAEAEKLRKARFAACFDEKKAAEYPEAEEIFRRAGENFGEVYAFLSKDENPNRKKLLFSLALKDAKDLKASVLEDHLDCKQGDLPEEIFVKDLLCPRIFLEELTSYRSMIRGYFDEETKRSFAEEPERIWEYIQKNITFHAEEEYDTTMATPVGVLTMGQGSPLAQKILFAAVCRSLNVAARLNPVTLEPEYYRDGEFYGVEAEEAGETECTESAVLTLNAEDGSAWKYYQTWTIGKWNGTVFETLNYEETVFDGKTLALTLEPGCYRLITSMRMPNGDQHAAYRVFELKAGDAKEIYLETVKKELDELLEHVELPEIQLEDMNGNSHTLNDLTKDGPILLAFLGTGEEPTEHVLNELIEISEKWNAKDAAVAAVVRTKADLENTTFQKARAAIHNMPLYLDPSDDAPAIAEKMGIDAEKLPLLILALPGNIGGRAYAGYNVGSVGLMLRLMEEAAKA
ncbi:transglutaminase domain-containing protein [Fusicatenibacter sp.]